MTIGSRRRRSGPLSCTPGQDRATRIASLSASDYSLLIEGKAAGSAALTRALHDFFDMAATMRVSARIYQLGGLQRKDMHVANSILDDVKSVVAAKAIDKTCLRWPDIPGLVDQYFAKSRGPIITGFLNGDHLSTFWLGGKPHRDANEGPAFHGVGQDCERLEYIVRGKSHRNCRIGPAIIDRNSECPGHTVIECRENGQYNRPVLEGAAVLIRCR